MSTAIIPQEASPSDEIDGSVKRMRNDVDLKPEQGILRNGASIVNSPDARRIIDQSGSIAFCNVIALPCEMGTSNSVERIASKSTSENDDDENTTHGVVDPLQIFFRNVWQKEPAIYRSTHLMNDEADLEKDSSPLSEAIKMGWNNVADLLHHCRQHSSFDSPSTESNTSPPLFFQNGRAITDPHTVYSSNPHAAYLDGCSVIVNHADFHHISIAELCEDLQQTFPHVYANAYLTPPNGYAVKPHADDRDVLVVQILGQKKWKIYKNVPVEFPFEREQVGKNGMGVDPSVLEGGLCFNNKEIVLCPGDVLYMPRGFVHEATTINNSHDNGERSDALEHSPSFHITIAIATHDWCVSTLLTESIRDALNNITDFRRALPIGPCKEYERSAHGSLSGVTYLEHQMKRAWSVIQDKVTSSVLEQNLRTKYITHNVLADEHRKKLKADQFRKRKYDDLTPIVGYAAASQLTLQSTLRISTPEERESVVLEEGRLRGLTVREETCTILLNLLKHFKLDPKLKKKVCDFRSLIKCVKGEEHDTRKSAILMVCDFTLLSFARCCVEVGALAMVNE